MRARCRLVLVLARRCLFNTKMGGRTCCAQGSSLSQAWMLPRGHESTPETPEEAGSAPCHRSATLFLDEPGLLSTTSHHLFQR